MFIPKFNEYDYFILIIKDTEREYKPAELQEIHKCLYNEICKSDHNWFGQEHSTSCVCVHLDSVVWHMDDFVPIPTTSGILKRRLLTIRLNKCYITCIRPASEIYSIDGTWIKLDFKPDVILACDVETHTFVLKPGEFNKRPEDERQNARQAIVMCTEADFPL